MGNDDDRAHDVLEINRKWEILSAELGDAESEAAALINRKIDALTATLNVREKQRYYRAMARFHAENAKRADYVKSVGDQEY